MAQIRDYINDETVIKDEIYKQFELSIACCICNEILIEPMMFMNCQVLCCKKCEEKWSQKKNTCPQNCPNAQYIESSNSQKLLSKLKFVCKNCEEVFNYDEMQKHSTTNCENKSQMKILREYSMKEKHMGSVNSKYK